MKKTIHKAATRKRRQGRIRSKVVGSAERPRLSVYKSNGYIYAQIIDDTKGITLAAASSLKMTTPKLASAQVVGEEVAKHAKAAGVTAVVFDRGGYIYTGAVKALAEGARKGGLNF